MASSNEIRCFECNRPIEDFCRDCERYLAVAGDTEEDRNAVYQTSIRPGALNLIPNECHGVKCSRCNTEFHNHCVMRRLRYASKTCPGWDGRCRKNLPNV